MSAWGRELDLGRRGAGVGCTEEERVIYLGARRKAHGPLEAVRVEGWGTRGGCRMSRRYTDCEGRTVSVSL